MTILFYNCKSLRFGSGPECKLIELANELVKNKISVKIVTTSSCLNQKENISQSQLKKQLNPKVKYYELPFISLPFSGSPLPTKLLGKYLKDVDIIYFYDGFMLQDLYILFNKLIYQKKTIYGNHAPVFINSPNHDFYARFITLNIVKFFDAIHVLTHQSYLFWQNRTSNPIYENVAGIDTNFFKYTPHPKNTKFNIVTVGRLDYQKGIDLFPQIISILDKKIGHDKYVLNISGSGPLKTEVTKLSQKRNLIYHGYCNNLAELLNQSDLYFSPTRYETLGSTLIEAQACGLPVVSSDIQGPSQIIKNKQQGLLSAVDRPDLYCQSIVYFYNLWQNKPSVYKKIKLKSRQNALNSYSWKILVKDYQLMYQQIHDR